MLLFGAMLLAGCGGPAGPPRQVVRGRITNGGEIMKHKEVLGKVEIGFRRIEQGKSDSEIDINTADYNQQDGTFTVVGPDGRGIQAGKYKISVTWKDDHPGGPDKLKDRFSEEKTKIVRDVDGAGEIVIDLAKEK